MPSTGDVLGRRYELGEELGEGGMATVFRARDRELRRDVAIKVLFPHLARRVEVVRRFQREARAAAALEHPNILRIYDVGGGDAEPPFIVMELIRGWTLLEELERRGPLLAELVACIGALLADALVAAHAAGIIHRDLKPSNVLVAPGGRLLLADFGVARLETEDSLVTRTGALLGTPAYMPPEQATGDVATARSDLYSLGATLYQLATGALPFGGSPAKVMAAIAAGQLVPPVRRRPAVGPDLSRAIVHLMEPDPAARPESATAVAAELRRLAAHGGLGEPAEELVAFGADPDAFARSRTSTVVGAVVRSAVAALDEDRLPRALALADRAAALAPADPSVTALVQRVTEGGRARARRRSLALIGLGLAAAAAASGVLALRNSEDTVAAIVPDASMPIAVDAAPIDAAPIDAAPIDAPPVSVDAIVVDAAPRLALRPALPAPIDAATPPAVDAAIDPPADAPIDAPAFGTLHVRNDTWCNLTIDGDDHGQISPTATIRLPAGRHVVRCAQPGSALAWRREVDIIPNQTLSLTESMLPDVEVLIATSGDRTTIDTQSAATGATVRLKPGQYRVTVHRSNRELTAGWVSIPRTRACRLRDVDGGKLVCDP